MQSWTSAGASCWSMFTKWVSLPLSLDTIVLSVILFPICRVTYIRSNDPISCLLREVQTFLAVGDSFDVVVSHRVDIIPWVFTSPSSWFFERLSSSKLTSLLSLTGIEPLRPRRWRKEQRIWRSYYEPSTRIALHHAYLITTVLTRHYVSAGGCLHFENSWRHCVKEAKQETPYTHQTLEFWSHLSFSKT